MIIQKQDTVEVKTEHKQKLQELFNKKINLKDIISDCQFQAYILNANKNKRLEQLLQLQNQLVQYTKQLTDIYGEGYIQPSTWTYHRK